MFVYNTPLTVAHLNKWLVSSGIYKDLKMLSMIKCNVEDEITKNQLTFVSQFPVLTQLYAEDFKNVA